MVKTAEATQVSRAASSMLFLELDFGVASNGTYPHEDFHRLLLGLPSTTSLRTLARKLINSLVDDDVDVESESRHSLARVLLYHLRGLDADAVDDQFDRVRDALLKEAVRNRLFT